MAFLIKRVPLDFDHTLGKPWSGYINPHAEISCPACNGSGYSPEAERLKDEWYWGPDGDGNGWSKSITQDEADALVASGRLMDLTHEWIDYQWKPKDRPPVTAAEVNAWASRRPGLGHDSINCYICVKARAKRLGFETNCPSCHGHGRCYPEGSTKAVWAEWKKEEPPTGEGYQFWSREKKFPVSPVYASKEGLIEWKARTFPWGLDYCRQRSFVDSLERYPLVASMEKGK